MRIELSDEAQADADAAIDWYIQQGALMAADDFIEEIDRTLQLLSRFPELGMPGRHDARALILHRLPYSLIYRLHLRVIRVIAIAHHSRRPGYWAGRR